jgi:hypothetical protein
MRNLAGWVQPPDDAASAFLAIELSPDDSSVRPTPLNHPFVLQKRAPSIASASGRVRHVEPPADPRHRPFPLDRRNATEGATLVRHDREATMLRLRDDEWVGTVAPGVSAGEVHVDLANGFLDCLDWIHGPLILDPRLDLVILGAQLDPDLTSKEYPAVGESLLNQLPDAGEG